MMKSPFILIKKLYEKQDIKFEEIKDLEIKDCIVLMTFLSRDNSILDILKRALGYIFTIDPKYFYIFLFCNIPKRNKAPYLKVPKKQKIEEDVLITKMKKIYKWGGRETEEHKQVLTKLINLDRKFFEEKWGVK